MLEFRRVNNKGQTLIEFALVFPILLLLTLGILEFGRYFWVANAVSNASREGARMAVVAPSLSADDSRVSETVVKAVQDAALSTEGLKVTNTGASEGGDFVQVVVVLPYKWFTPLTNFISGGKAPTIKREIEMRYEGSPSSWTPGSGSPTQPNVPSEGSPRAGIPEGPGEEPADDPWLGIPEAPLGVNPDDEPRLGIPEGSWE